MAECTEVCRDAGIGYKAVHIEVYTECPGTEERHTKYDCILMLVSAPQKSDHCFQVQLTPC